MKSDEIKNWAADVLAHTHDDMVCAFCCGNFDKYGVLDDYFHCQAIDDPEGVTYITYDRTKPDNCAAIALFTLSCSAIMLVLENGSIKLEPAVELKMFALDQKYQHLAFEDADTRITLGDVVLSTALKYISDCAKRVFGATRVVLYANSENSCSFYQRNGFTPFLDNMHPNQDPFLDGCIPMIYALE